MEGFDRTSEWLPQKALEEAEKLCVGDKISELLYNRKPARGISIDSQYTKDKDDAFQLTEKDGRWILDVSIADPASLILPGSFLDNLAYEHGFTRYLSYGVFHMLPPLISTNTLSLLAGTSHPALTVSMEIDPRDFQVKHTSLERTSFTSSGELTYQEADEAQFDRKNTHHEMMKNLGMISAGLARNRNSGKNFNPEEAQRGYYYNEDGEKIKLHSYEISRSHGIVEQIMRLTNEKVAELCYHNKIPILYRNQDRGSRKNQSPAYYSKEPHGHFSLGLDHYTHFTSPLRRYPDKSVHEAIIRALGGYEDTEIIRDLDEAGRHLNMVSESMKRGSQEYFKQKALQLAQQQLSSKDIFASLTPDEQAWSIRQVVRARIYPVIYQREISNLLESGLLAPETILSLMLNKEVDYELRGECLKYLIYHPSIAIKLFEIATYRLGWKNPDYHIEDQSSDENESYNVSAEITLGNQVYSSNHYCEPERGKAKGYAAVGLWHQIFFNVRWV